MPVGTRFEDADPDDTVSDTLAPAAAPEKEDTAAQERPAIGRFGRAHATYLKRTQRHVYSQLVAEGKLGTYLAQIDEQANVMLELLIRQMAEREGVTEELKAVDQMEWVRLMNSIRNRAEESQLIPCKKILAPCGIKKSYGNLAIVVTVTFLRNVLISKVLSR